QKHHGGEHPEYVRAAKELASLLTQIGDHQTAEDLYRSALKAAEAAWGTDHVECGRIHRDLGMVHRSLGDYKRAEFHLGVGVRILRSALGNDHAEAKAATASLQEAWERL